MIEVLYTSADKVVKLNKDKPQLFGLEMTSMPEFSFWRIYMVYPNGKVYEISDHHEKWFRVKLNRKDLEKRMVFISYA